MAVQITVEGLAPKYLTAPAYTLGRAAECDVRLPENDRLVSRQHARLERDESGTWWIVDLSANGTFVNGERMSGRLALHEGDQIGIGRTQISFALAVVPPRTSPEEDPARAADTLFVPAAARRSRAKIPESVPPLAVPRGTGAANGARAAAPVSTPAAARSAEAGLASVAASTKECVACGHHYAAEHDNCPSCGESGFRVKGATRPAVTVAPPDAPAAPAPVPVSIPFSAPTPAPPIAPTPFDFDRAAPLNIPTRPMAPDLTPEMLQGVTFGTRGPAPKPPGRGLGIAAASSGAAMLLALFLPWALSASGAATYARLLSAAMDGDLGGGGVRFFAVVPAIAVLCVLGGAAWSLATRGKAERPAAQALAWGGAAGVLGAGALFSRVGGRSGTGFWVFAAASLVAAVLGMLRLDALRRAGN